MHEPKVANVEALKVPMFYVWHKLGYGSTYTQSPRGANAYWLASFKTSPPEYLSECIRLLQHGEIPYVDMDLKNSLIGFYSSITYGKCCIEHGMRHVMEHCHNNLIHFLLVSQKKAVTLPPNNYQFHSQLFEHL